MTTWAQSLIRISNYEVETLQKRLAEISARKAEAEMRAGGWLVSLEFEVPGVPPAAHLHGAGRRDVFAYRVGAAAAAGGVKQASTGAQAGR